MEKYLDVDYTGYLSYLKEKRKEHESRKIKKRKVVKPEMIVVYDNLCWDLVIVSLLND